MNVLLLRKPRGAPYKYNMIIVALLMFVFATLDVAFGLRHNLDAFIFYHGPGGPDGEFDDISDWVNVMKVSLMYVRRSVNPVIHHIRRIDSGHTDSMVFICRE